MQGREPTSRFYSIAMLDEMCPGHLIFEVLPATHYASVAVRPDSIYVGAFVSPICCNANHAWLNMNRSNTTSAYALQQQGHAFCQSIALAIRCNPSLLQCCTALAYCLLMKQDSV